SFVGSNTFSGAIYATTGPYFGLGSFDSTNVRATRLGTATINFLGNTGTFQYSIDAATQTKAIIKSKAIVQQPFGNGVPQPPYGDDYPLKDANFYPTEDPRCAPDYWGFCNRECTSFVAWRMNRDAARGTNHDPRNPPYFFTN